MREQLPHLHQFLKQLQQVPYLASKNIYRVAHYFLELSPERRAFFMQTLEQACTRTIACEICCAWKEAAHGCIWCDNKKRHQNIVCVIETWHDLCAIERAGGFDGVFHILGGSICPLDGVGPEDLSIDLLVDRISKSISNNDPIAEIIFALNPTLEGEATAAFIARKLIPFRDTLRITCLSRGVPVGSSLELMDRITVGKAIAERRPF